MREGIKDMPQTTVVVGHDRETIATVEELLERQLALVPEGAEGRAPSFVQWGKDAPFVQWSKLGAGPLTA